MFHSSSLAPLFSGGGDTMSNFNTSLEEFNEIFQDEDSHRNIQSDAMIDEDGNGKDITSPEVARTFSLVLTISVGAALSVFGVVVNILNIIVFVKQGFQESVNISLCALSVSDLLSAATLLWLAICQNPLFLNADLPFLPMEIEALTSGIPHAIAMNITGWLTVFVTFERCLCVVFPLKIKDIISCTRAKIVVVTIYVLVTAAQMPSYYTLRLGKRFVPERNKTLLGIYEIEGSKKIDTITFYIVNVAAPVLSFVLVIACSVILIVHLKLKTKWRKTALATDSATGKDTDLSPRDWKVVKMVTVVAVIFIVSFLPYVMISTIMSIEPNFRFYGDYRYTFSVCVSVGSLLEAFNAAANIFVYLKMSSKYRTVFNALFCAGRLQLSHQKTKRIEE